MINRAYHKINKLLQLVAGIILIGLILLVCSNIVFRIFWFPIRGTFELVGLFGAVICGFSLAYTQDKGAHIAVDILFKRFSKTLRKYINLINHLICVFVFSVGLWRIIVWAIDIWKAQELTETLRIVYYPFILCVAFGLLMLVISLIMGFYIVWRS